MREDWIGIRAFVAIAIGLLTLRLFYGFVAFPVAVAEALSVLNAVLFVGLPIYAMFRAGSHRWRPSHALVFLCVGAMLHVAGALLARYAVNVGSAGEVWLTAVVQTGILGWALGLGALLALKIGDKNLMIPVAVFLVGFDMFLVFNPDSPTRRALDGASQFSQSVLATVPAAKSDEAPKAGVRDLARVGPADLLFAATFFALLFRFEMRARQTLAWLVPVLVAYLLVVIKFGHLAIGPLSLALLPAMVPIGLTLLIVNRKEFRLHGQEILGVVLVTLLAGGLAAFGIYRAKQAANLPASPIAPSLPASDRAASVLEGSPSQGP